MYGILIIIPLFSEGSREISINYEAGRRIPFNEINIQLNSKNENGYQITIQTKQLKNYTGYEYSNTERTIKIDKEYFDYIYEELLNINYSEIIKNSPNIGADGTGLKIKVGTFQNHLIINIRNFNIDIENRKLEKLNEIMKNIFNKINLLEWL
jgi:hypothetical protein